MTQQLKSFSEFLLHNGMSLAGVISFFIFVLFVIFSTETGQRKGYEILYSIPVLGKMIQAYYLIRFSRYTKIML
jgi:type II secretory pathway component PulF